MGRASQPTGTSSLQQLDQAGGELRPPGAGTANGRQQAMEIGLIGGARGQPAQPDLGRRRQRERGQLGGGPAPARRPDRVPTHPRPGTVTATSVIPSRRHSTRSRATSSSARAGAGSGPKRSSHSVRTSSICSTVRTAASRR